MCRLLLWKCSTCKAPPHARFGSWGGAVPSARRRISRRGFGAALKPLGDAPGMARAMFKAARHCGSTDMMHMAAGLGKAGLVLASSMSGTPGDFSRFRLCLQVRFKGM